MAKLNEKPKWNANSSVQNPTDSQQFLLQQLLSQQPTENKEDKIPWNSPILQGLLNWQNKTFNWFF